MENENSAFEFLGKESSIRYFSEANFALTQGKHIQNYGYDTKIWDYINDNYGNLQHYYELLYNCFLRRESNDRDVYFYLDFPEEGYGRFTRDRCRELEDKHVVFGILLLNSSKEKFFEAKEMTWDDIEQITEEGEHKELWQRLLYGELKRNYTPNEKDEVKRKIERTLAEFERMGWINWINQEAFHFEIMPSIDRLAKMYAREINEVELTEDYIHEQLS
jgi:hypothetical protein